MTSRAEHSSTIRRLHLIANPKGGVGDNVALAGRAEAFLAEHGIATRLHLTECAGHAVEIVADLDCDPDAGDAICGIGGDGTMHELVNGMMARDPDARVPLSLLPGGTGNAFLHDLDCLDAECVLERIASNARRSIDLFEVEFDDSGHKRFGFNIVGWGLFSAANQLAEKLRWIGRRRYDFAALLHILRNRCYRGVLEMDGEKTVEARFVIIAASNTCHTGQGMRLAPKAELDDGKLDLMYILPTSRRQLVALLGKVKSGAHLDEESVHYQQVSRLKLTTDETLPINLDGELVESGSFEASVLPGALDLLI